MEYHAGVFVFDLWLVGCVLAGDSMVDDRA